MQQPLKQITQAIRYLLAFLLFSPYLSAQTVIKQKADPEFAKSTLNWKKADEKDYSIQYPADWEFSKAGQMGTSFTVVSPMESNQDQFRENINLVIQSLGAQPIDLNKYVEISENQVKTMITHSSIIESKRVKDGANEYHRMVFTGDQGVYHLRFVQQYRIVNGSAYVLTFTCEQSKFAKFKENGEEILNSFKLK